MTKIAPRMMMMSLLNPSNASFGASTPPTTNAISSRNVTISTEIRSVAKSAIAMTSSVRTKAMESVIGCNRSCPARCAEDVQNLRIYEDNSRVNAKARRRPRRLETARPRALGITFSRSALLFHRQLHFGLFVGMIIHTAVGLIRAPFEIHLHGLAVLGRDGEPETLVQMFAFDLEVVFLLPAVFDDERRLSSRQASRHLDAAIIDRHVHLSRVSIRRIDFVLDRLNRFFGLFCDRLAGFLRRIYDGFGDFFRLFLGLIPNLFRFLGDGLLRGLRRRAAEGTGQECDKKSCRVHIMLFVTPDLCGRGEVRQQRGSY